MAALTSWISPSWTSIAISPVEIFVQRYNRCSPLHQTCWPHILASRRSSGVVFRAWKFENTSRIKYSDGIAAEAGEDLQPVHSVDEATLIVIEKIGLNKRRIEAFIKIASPLQVVWELLTDYEKLTNFVPSLAECQMLERRPDGATLLQIGEQNLALGIKFRAKGIVNVTEIPLEALNDKTHCAINFEMMEGDFEIFKGSWRLEQLKMDATFTNTETHLSYVVDVQPKLWLPVGLVEGILAREIQRNLISIRDAALLKLRL